MDSDTKSADATASLNDADSRNLAGLSMRPRKNCIHACGVRGAGCGVRGAGCGVRLCGCVRHVGAPVAPVVEHSPVSKNIELERGNRNNAQKIDVDFVRTQPKDPQHAQIISHGGQRI